MILGKNQLEALFENLRFKKEKEWFDRKEAKNDYSFEDLGRYFSAISNEANLKGVQYGWLIFGVADSGHIVGTNYKNTRDSLDKLKKDIADHTNDRLTFIEIYELYRSEGRIIMFQIPAAPAGIPTSWKGHYYGRENESLAALSLQELEYIRSLRYSDWSAGICEGATINDLDPAALQKARAKYKEKNPKIAGTVDEWNDETFLNKTKIAIDGKITRTAIILLGKDESEHYLSPFSARITWILEDEKGIKQDYKHFGPPFIISVDDVFAKIRNLTYRFIPGNTLFPIEFDQYDPYVIREALHNCIAHQDYTLKGRINIIEKKDQLLFLNEGSFIPGKIERLFEPGYMPAYYRNDFLVKAMVNLGMIDTITSGIYRIFELQKKRYFPMPDYDLSETNRVKVTVYGKVIDENYTRMLFNKTDLSITTVISLDRVQKHKKISKDEYGMLKQLKLVEGRYPNIYVSSSVAEVTGEKAQYIRNKALDDTFYKNMVVKYLSQYGSASKEDIHLLLIDKLSDALNKKKKEAKIKNLLYSMSKREHRIKNIGTNRKAKWIIDDNSEV